MWIGSADMMHRNLDRRVELIVRVADPAHVRRLSRLLALGMDDATSSWWLDGDGGWTRKPGEDLQETLVRERRAKPDE